VVKKGQVIAILESVVEQSQVDAARVRSTTDVAIRLKTAVYTAAAAKLERQRKLRVAAVTSEQALEEAEAAASVAKEEIEQARLSNELATSSFWLENRNSEGAVFSAPAQGRRHFCRTPRG
jgi:multidrug efflux pump subunit AcrA (membrane-fusion protein)